MTITKARLEAAVWEKLCDSVKANKDEREFRVSLLSMFSDVEKSDPVQLVLAVKTALDRLRNDGLRAFFCEARHGMCRENSYDQYERPTPQTWFERVDEPVIAGFLLFSTDQLYIEVHR